MVARQIAEPGGRQAQAIQAELIQPVRGSLQRHMLHALARQRGEHGGQRHRIGRRQAPAARMTGGDQAERAEAGRRQGGQRPELAQEVDGACLAVRASDGNDVFGLAAGQQGRHAGQCASRRVADDQRAARHPGGPYGPAGGEDGGGTGLHRLSDVAAAVGVGSRQGREQEAGADAPAIGGDTGDGDGREPRIDTRQAGPEGDVSERAQRSPRIRGFAAMPRAAAPAGRGAPA